MSAFVCSPEHFKVLGSFAASPDRGHCSPHRVSPGYMRGIPNIYGLVGDKLASAYANVLYAENVRSVSARYPRDAVKGTLPGPIDMPETIAVSVNHSRPSAVAILKMCDCLEYQSCETDDYHDGWFMIIRF